MTRKVKDAFKDIKAKIKRYGIAQIVATIATIYGYSLSFRLFGSTIFSAYFAVFCDAIAFYLVMIIQQIYIDYNQRTGGYSQYGVRGIIKTFKSLLNEFSGPEFLDTLIFSPILINFGNRFFGQVGIVLSKWISDGFFIYLSHRKRKSIVADSVEKTFVLDN